MNNKLIMYIICIMSLVGLVACDNNSKEQALRISWALVQHETLVIASIGDSFASGEGNPDQLIVPEISAPVWTSVSDNDSTICHRSLNNGHQFAVDYIAPLWRPDAKESLVEYKSFACAGAAINRGLLEQQYSGTSGLRPYVYEEASCGNSPTCQQSQIEQVSHWLIEEDMMLDILNVSIGGNDIGFSKIIEECTNPLGSRDDNCRDVLIGDVQTRLSSISDNLNRVATAINSQIIAPLDERLDNHLADDYKLKILLVGYPNPLRDENEKLCDEWDDNFYVFPDLHISNGQIAPEALEPASFYGGSLIEITNEEAQFLEADVLEDLNLALESSVQKINEEGVFPHQEWLYLENMVEKTRSHGFCSTNRWFNTFRDSYEKQGDFMGVIHPNLEGHKAYGEAIATKLSEVLGLTWTPVEIEIAGIVKVTDDEIGTDEFEEFSIDNSVLLLPPDPFNTYNSRDKNWLQYQFCVGDEVRVDLNIDFDLDWNNIATANIETILFESTECWEDYGEEPDMEDHQVDPIHISNISSYQAFLYNDGLGGGDWASFSLDFERVMP